MCYADAQMHVFLYDCLTLSQHPVYWTGENYFGSA